MARLLILSCSQHKRTDSGLLPAIERYDGPAFRVLRKFIRSSDSTSPGTYILSAEYGLLAADVLIPYYDRRMTPARAALLRPSVQRRLRHVFAASTVAIGEVFICASKPYLSALGVDSAEEDCGQVVGNMLAYGNAEERTLPAPRLAQGSIGKRMADLRDWLYGAPPPPLEVNVLAKPVVFRGIELSMTACEVLQIASEEAARDPAGAARFEAWYVPVGEQRVAPKWLVQVLTGVSVGAFRTLDARRLIAQLGIEVARV